MPKLWVIIHQSKTFMKGKQDLASRRCVFFLYFDQIRNSENAKKGAIMPSVIEFKVIQV